MVMPFVGETLDSEGPRRKYQHIAPANATSSRQIMGAFAVFPNLHASLTQETSETRDKG